jgi:hypothetical protein
MVGVNIAMIHHHRLAALGAAGLVAGGLALAAPTAAADPPSAVAISGPDDSYPTPSYRPGPKGDNVPPPEKKDKKPAKIYTDCDQVRADGKLPMYRGQPGYAPYLDPDNNGIACDGY